MTFGSPPPAASAAPGAPLKLLETSQVHHFGKLRPQLRSW